jgi:hypothetical protein
MRRPGMPRTRRTRNTGGGGNRRPDPSLEDYYNHQRARELQEFAEHTAYEEVPTQEEMLSGGLPIRDSRPRKGADPELTEEIDEVLYEAAQQGNIGGG